MSGDSARLGPKLFQFSRTRYQFVPSRFGRYLAEHLEDAKFVMVPGMDHMPWTGDADALVAVFDTPTTAVRRAALAILDATSAAGFTLRAGVHTGEYERRGDDLAGMAVHITPRVCARAEPGQILVSRTVCDVVTGSGLEFESRGEFDLKGLPQAWELFALRP